MINIIKPSLSALLFAGLTQVAHVHPNEAEQLPNSERETVKSKHRGVSWVASRDVSEDHFKPLVENHVNWIAQTPFGWQQNYNSPTFELVRSGRVRWGERDEGLERTAELARKFGIKTLLKPHIWLRNRSDDKWRLHIEMDNERDWQSWFESYRTFILHYAQLAEKNGIEALSVGTELHATVKKRPEDWRRIIAEVRKVYSGQLTYSANWYEEFEDVEFWDELDFIGIQAYFPLTEKVNPSVEDLNIGWEIHIKEIARVQRKYGKPVLFTEIGYKSTVDSAIRPWEWLRAETGTASGAEAQTQANCYEAFFQNFWDKPWFAGAYFWKWFPESGRSRRGYDRFALQGNPAEKVMAKWYGQTID